MTKHVVFKNASRKLFAPLFFFHHYHHLPSVLHKAPPYVFSSYVPSSCAPSAGGVWYLFLFFSSVGMDHYHHLPSIFTGTTIGTCAPSSCAPSSYAPSAGGASRTFSFIYYLFVGMQLPGDARGRMTTLIVGCEVAGRAVGTRAPPWGCRGPNLLVPVGCEVAGRAMGTRAPPWGCCGPNLLVPVGCEVAGRAMGTRAPPWGCRGPNLLVPVGCQR